MTDNAEFQVVPLSRLRESTANPRQHFPEASMQQLTENVAKVGVLVPLLVRPDGGGFRAKPSRYGDDRWEVVNLRNVIMATASTEQEAVAEASKLTDKHFHYEIIDGARRYRAAMKAGIKELPVHIREMSDGEALEAMVIANLQREDVHPLEEAMGYLRLMQVCQLEVEAVAAKVGKSTSYVYQRLKLTELVEPAKESFLSDEITAGHAILIARLQPVDQEKALEACFERDWRDGNKSILLGVRQLAGWIQQNVHLDLHGAPFKKDDSGLLPAAGPCTTCPKRTGFVPALFPDVAAKDTCTDRACFQQKLQAHVAQKKAQLEAKGEKLLELSTEYRPYNYKPKPSDPISKDKVREVTRKDRCEFARKAIITEGAREVGKVLDVCMEPGCKTHGRNRYGYQRDPKEIAKQKAAEEDRKRKAETRRRILEEVLSRVPANLEREDLELIAASLTREMQLDTVKPVVARHAWAVKKAGDWGGQDYRGTITSKLPGLTRADLLSILIELALMHDVIIPSWGDRKPEGLLAAAKRYGVDAAGIEKQVAAEFAGKKKAKQKIAAAGKKAAKAAKGKKPSIAETSRRMKEYWAKKRAEASKKAKGGKDPAGELVHALHTNDTKKLKQLTSKKTRRPVPAGADDPACEVCGCRELMACPGGCAWDPELHAQGRFVCTNCTEAV